MFIEQALRLVSQAPDNLAYHILTLLVVQSVLAIASWQWRQNRADRFSGRLAGAAAIIFLLRIILAGVLISNNQSDLRTIIPPLERALDMCVTAVLVWAFIPTYKVAPRLSEVVLVLGLVAIAVTYYLAVQDWQLLLAYDITYDRSNQYMAWEIAQLVVIVIGLLSIGVIRPRDWALKVLVLAPLGAAHLAHLLRVTPTGEFVLDSAVPYWVRLAYLFSLPLLASIAYRHNLAEILGAQIGKRPLGESFAELLDWSGKTVMPADLQANLKGSVAMVARLMGANIAAVGVLRDDGNVGIVALRPDEEAFAEDNTYRWILKLADWPGMQLALRQRSAVELLPNGIGARQLFSLYQELGLPVAGATLIEPMFGSQEQQVGVLIIGGSPNLDRWSADDKALSPHVAHYVALVVERALAFDSLVAGVPLTAMVQTTDDVLQQEIKAVEAELEAAIKQTNVVSRRLEQKQRELTELRQTLQTRNEQLTEQEAALNDLRSRPNIERVFSLEEEVLGLREALQQAEEALAMASASEAGLSTDWVVMAMTRYSAELEEAQRRVAFLESQVDGSEQVEINTFVTMVSEDLRRPLASIAGYTDILLSETMGMLTKRQMQLLEKVQDSTMKLEQLLSGLTTQATHALQARSHEAVLPINVTETIDAAVSEIMGDVREKELVLDLEFGTELPPLAVQRDVLYRVTLDLLRNAVAVTPEGGRVRLVAEVDLLEDPDSGVELEFLQLVVSDAGLGIPPEARQYLFNTATSNVNGHATDIQGVGGVTEVAHAYRLASVNGGRVWVDSEAGVGSHYFVLLPVLGKQ